MNLDDSSQEFKYLVNAIDEAYKQFDSDRLLLERSTDITSDELIEMNRTLKEKLDDRIKITGELEEAKLKAEEATKLKDKFVSLVAHDLKSPVISAIGLLEAILDDYKSTGTEKTMLPIERTIDLCHSQLKTIDDLLSSSRLKGGEIVLEKRFLNLRSVVKDAIRNNIYLAEEKGINLINKIDEQTRIFADSALIKEVLHNLINNAVKFCSDGDNVTIGSPGKNSGVITVADTGHGVEESVIPNLFHHDKNIATHGSYGELGFGLGLPYSHEIVKAHGGDLFLQNMPKRGAIFTIRLPSLKPVVLLATDDEFTKQITRRVSKKIDIEIKEVDDCRKAIEIVTEMEPSLALIDIQLHGGDECELFEKLHDINMSKEIPAIIITSDTSNMSGTDYPDGANDFIIKPIREDDLIPRILHYMS